MPETCQPSVNAVNSDNATLNCVRLPPFQESDPELWFVMAECTFDSLNVTNTAIRYASVINALNPRQVSEVRDIIMAADQRNYDALKVAMMKRFGESQAARTRQLLEHEAIGDRKPSQFLLHLRGLAGTTMPDATLRTIWLGRLPQSMQNILVVQRDASLTTLADLADAIMDNASTHASRASTYAVTHAPMPDISAQFQRSYDAQLRQHETLIAELRAEIAELRIQRERPRNRGRSQSRRRNNSQARHAHSTRNDNGSYCYYHSRFGDRAYRCIKPCSYDHPRADSASTSENANGSH